MTLSHTIRIFVLFLLAAVLLGAVSAELTVATYEHDTNFNSAFERTRACSCGTTTDYFTLENRGDFPATYHLSLDTEVDWIELHRSVLTLYPGEQTLIPVSLMPPCGTDDVTSYQVHAVSEFGRFRAVDRTVTAHTCENVIVEVVPDDQHVLPCEPAYFDVTVRNTGTFDERYTLSASSDAVRFAQNTVRLAPGEHAVVDAVAEWACDVHGTQEFDVYADAERNDLRAEAPVTVEILWNYELLAEAAPYDGAICAEIQTVIPLLVTNTGSVQNTYSLSTTTPFASLARTQLTVAPESTETVLLYVQPLEHQLGAHDIAVNIQAEVGGANKQVVVPVTVRDCFEHEVLVMPQREQICAGDTNFTLQVQNRGENTETFTFWTSGDIFSEVATNGFTLRPGEHANALLRLVVPDRDEPYTIQVHTEQTPGIGTVTEVEFDAVSNAACTQPVLSGSKLDLYTDTGTVPIIVENTGIEAAVYQIRWEGKLFVIAEDEIFLAPGEQTVIHLMPRADVALEPGKYVERFSLTSHREEYREDMHITLRDKDFLTKVWLSMFGPAGVDWCHVLLVVLFIVAVVMIIVLILTFLGIMHASTVKNRDTKALVLGLLAVLFALAAIIVGAQVQPAITVIDEPMGTNVSGLYHETLMNEELLIDLSQYFIDPDEDSLQYVASQPEHLMVEVEGDTATVTPEKNWAGQEHIVFTAIDEDGLTADSPIMTVRTLAVRKASFGAWVATYCQMINLLLIAIILLLVIARMYLSPDKDLEKRIGEPFREAFTPTPVQSVELQPIQPPAERGQRGVTSVSGDVVAGDKVTIVGKQSDELFIASENGKKVHRPDCGLAQRTPKEKRVVIRGKEAALKQNYTPCKTCRPFE